MNKDILGGLALLAVAGFYHRASGDIADSTLSDEVGAAGLPRLLTIALVILAGILIARALLLARSAPKAAPAVADTAPAEPADDGDGERDASLPRAFGFLLLGAGYIALLPYVGYVAGVALLIAAVALYEGAPRRWTVPAAAIGGGLLYWAIFVKLLGVNQPVGSLLQGLLP